MSRTVIPFGWKHVVPRPVIHSSRDARPGGAIALFRAGNNGWPVLSFGRIIRVPPGLVSREAQCMTLILAQLPSLSIPEISHSKPHAHDRDDTFFSVHYYRTIHLRAAFGAYDVATPTLAQA